MQIALGRKGDYSVRAMIELARHHGSGRRKSREIARTMDIPERYLPQLLAPLVHAGLLVATAGPDGGYELAVPPDAITLLRVIELSEGPLEAPECVFRGGPCDWEGICPAHDAWVGGRAALARQLDLTTLADLAARDAAIERGDVTKPAVALHPITVARRGIRDAQVKPRGRTRKR